jgi:hypothetical protein
MDTFFLLILLTGALAGLALMLAAAVLLFKRISGQTTIEIKPLGTLKTGQNGTVLVLVGAALFYFTCTAYAQVKHLADLKVSLAQTNTALDSAQTNLVRADSLISNYELYTKKLSDLNMDKSVKFKGILDTAAVTDTLAPRRWLLRLDRQMMVGGKMTDTVAVNLPQEDLNSLLGKRVEVRGIPLLRNDPDFGRLMVISADSSGSR